MSSQYEVLDSHILNAADTGHNPLYERTVRAEAQRLAEASGREAFRVIDGRLQALRKAKKIEFAPIENGPRAWRRVHHTGGSQ